MILDSFKLTQLIVQIQYPNALELWDKAGTVNRRIQRIWPDTEIVGTQVSPNQVSLKNSKAQIDTGLTQSTVSLTQLKTIDQHSSEQIVETFQAWRSELALTKLDRVSSRAIYAKNISMIRAANQELFALGLCRLPKDKVFDQPTDAERNTFDLTYRFEDAASFAFLRISTEQVVITIKANPDIPAIKDSSESRNRLIIDFDRGLKQPIDASSFRMDEWLKGFSHLLRRDLEKVLVKE